MSDYIDVTFAMLSWLGPVTFVFSASLIALLCRPASILGLVDRPSNRKHHRHPVPLVGGVAMCAAFCFGVLLLPVKPADWPVLLTGMVLLTLVGLYDDRHSSRPATRLLFQAIAVLLMVLGSHVVLGDLGDLLGLGQVWLGWAAALFTLIGVIGMINAFNMIDGLDGLAGGTGFVVTGWLIVLCLSAPAATAGDLGALLVLAAAIAGFLVFNLRHPWRTRASVFMGDAGSTMLGFVLSWFLIHFSQGEQALMAPITAVWIMALPLLDTITVIVRRVGAGRSPFAADRQHLHHLLLGRGFSDGQVTAILLGMTCATGGLGLIADWLGTPEALRFYAFVGVFLLYYRFTTGLLIRQPHAHLSGRERRWSSVAMDQPESADHPLAP
ncbi:MraY family glycosyltransferase [uncultured Lamprocystis sp.]|jgi:UDP-GlcNAc:undecaprenyl-phosphate GlcNAc-1-phosphate transferase|uniref:MraY family glycosyltransferase n=1 Tax=uncultured Lamprocystis sp. TaxID=543132 RepID=UPI0025D34F57|nr:MraY family glycosyltransferase [uncultured Lamprocystis sp.]